MNYKYIFPQFFVDIENESLLTGGKRSICFENNSGERKYLRKQPVFHDDPDHCRVFNDLSDAIVTYPPASILSVQNVMLVGYRTYLTTDGFFFNDELYPSSESLSVWLDRLSTVDGSSNEMTNLESLGSGDFRYIGKEIENVSISTPVIVLCSDEPSNYGSFLFRCLSKFTGPLRSLNIKILAPCAYPSMRDAFAAIGIGGDQLIVHDPHKRYHLAHAIIPTLRNPHAFLDESTLGLFAKLRHEVGHDRLSTRRLFISRKNLSSTSSGYRELRNEGEVVDLLKRLNFEIFEPQNASFSEQVAKFSAASIIVGQSGAALFNSVFCYPGTVIVDIETEPHWIHAHMCIFSSLNLRYCIFEGKSDFSERNIHAPFTVNALKLFARVSKILESIDE